MLKEIKYQNFKSMKESKNIFEREDNQPDHILPRQDNSKMKDFSQLKKTLEKTLNENLENLNMKFSSKLIDLEKNQEEQNLKFNKLIANIYPQKDITEKINELIIFRKKTMEQMTSNDFKLNQLQKDLSNSSYKYDRLYLDNLFIPGTIGDYCRYKNLKEYIEVDFFLYK